MEILLKIQQSGMVGAGILVSTLVALLAGGLLLVFSRTRRSAWIIVRLACVPLLLGIVGVFWGYRGLQTALGEVSSSMDPEMLQEAREAGMQIVRFIAGMGIVGSALVFGLAAVAFWCSSESTRGDERSD